jgi:hypothetical protein
MNGFDQLERQLRRTVASRAVRRRRAPLLRTLSLAAAVVGVAAAVAAAATGVIGGGSGQGVDGLLDSIAKAEQSVPVCKIHGPSRKPVGLSTEPASLLAQRAFPALRRPPTAYERAVGRKFGGMFGKTQVIAGGARLLRAADGRRFLLIVTAGQPEGLFPGPACVALEQAALDQRAPHVDAAVLAGARQVLDREAAAYRANARRESLIFLALRDGNRFSEGGGTFTEDAVAKGTGSIGEVGRHETGHTVVTGLVPEPATYVILKSRSRAITPIRVPVPDQVFDAILPKGFGNHVAVQWHTSSGRLIHVLHMDY